MGEKLRKEEKEEKNRRNLICSSADQTGRRLLKTVGNVFSNCKEN